MFERRLYKVILFMTLIISLISIVGNFIIGLPLIINIKWFVLFAISFIGYIKEQKNKKSDTYKFLYFFFVITVIIPVGYIDAGNLSGSNSLAYMFIFMISSVFIFKGIERYSLVALNIGSYFVLRTVAYHIPTFVRVYSDRMLFLDQVIQVPLAMIMAYFLIRGFSNAFEEQKKKLETDHLELQEMHDQLQVLAERDMLTNLYNRRGFDKILGQISQEEQMKNDDIYILIFDLDNFKNINDTFGHTVGDKVLQDFSKVLIDKVKTPHTISRWGGDEFAMVYKGKRKHLEDLIFELRESYHQIVKNLKISSSISFGYLKWHHEDDENAVIRKADQALYKSKNNKILSIIQ
ncbi:MAG: GGDEF domain-containing protein [Clostridiales bacterium]|nr:GGDEF domain-containing protein [Clostridiales bacterium]